MSGRILSSGKVVVKKGGVLRGTVNAKSFLVDRGGEFSGELTIGQSTMVQGDLLKPAADDHEPDHDSDAGTDFTLAPV